MRVRLRVRLLVAIAATLAAAALLVIASRASLSYERAMKAAAEGFIAGLRDVASVTIGEEQLREARTRLTDGQTTKIELRAVSGRVTQVWYFRGRTLVAGDRHDERGDMIRRDFFDGEERVRIRAFYGNSREYLAHYLDEGGNVFRVEVLGPLPVSLRPTYGG
jgi:hypothetical protein